MRRILDVNVPKGEVAFSLLNTYSTIVVKTDSLTAIFDPVEIELYEGDVIDVIIITHEHSDHFDQDLVIDIHKQKKIPVLTTPFLAQRLDELGEYVKPLKVGDSFGLKDTTFYAEYSNHSANQPLSFIICTKVANIYHPNDSRPFHEMSLIRRKYSPDLMIYTGNSLGEIPEIVDMIRPRTIVSYSDPRFKDMDIPGVEIKTLNHGEVYSYSSSF